ncbi:MAG: LEA type 2 family protein [Gammaproteobacteria bacterium]
MFVRSLVPALASLLLCACASLQPGDPLQVTVGGVEPLPGEGLELRLLVKLRVQNPNDAPLDYDGVYVRLDVQGKTFASGVSDARGTVPRFGETVIAVPITVSVLRMVRQAMGVMDGQPVDRLRYELHGKLNGAGFRTARFQSEGDLTLPGGAGSASGRPRP